MRSTNGIRRPAVPFLALASLAIGCSPNADDSPGRDAHDSDGVRDEAAVPDVADDASSGDDSVEPEAPDTSDTPDTPDATDYSSDRVCDEEDLPLEYDVSSDVLVVLDRSGSMIFSLNPVKDALNTIVSSAEDRIWFGLMPFPSSVAPNACTLFGGECAAPATPHVEPGPLRAADIATALAGLGVCGSTPTSATLRLARTYLAAAPTGHARYVLLATDGVPNCSSSLDPATCTCLDTDVGCDGNPEACLDDQASYDALDVLLEDGIPTYVIGMGMWLGTDRDVMEAMASHGGTDHFYPAEDPGRIISAFDEIMGTIVVSCVFDLHPGPDADPAQVNLYVGGEVVPRDTSHEDGWDYVDEDTVEFYGPICDTILAGDVSTVGASYGCPTILM